MANVVTDFTKAPEQILLDLINNDNTSALTTAQVTLGTPSTSGGAENTSVTLTAVAGSGYSGSQTVTYNRVDIATVPGSRPTEFPVGSATKISDMLPQINAQYQINLTAADIVDATLPTFDGTPNEVKTFELVMAAGALVYLNQVTLSIHANDIPLTTVITNTALNGLTYVQPS